MSDRPKCEHCKEGCAYREATCFGSYEGDGHAYACDECCGHQQEDGHCDPIDSIVQPCCIEVLKLKADIEEGLQSVQSWIELAQEKDKEIERLRGLIGQTVKEMRAVADDMKKPLDSRNFIKQ